MDVNELIAQALSVITTWQQAGAVAGLIIAVNLLTNLFKVQAVSKHVPAVVLPWIAVVLGGVGAFLLALSAGKPLGQAVIAGIMAGLGAIGTHELVKSSKPAVRAAARKMARQPMVALFLIIIPLGFSCALRGECAQPENASSLKCKIVNNVLDCTVPELKSTIEAFLPVALALVDKLKNPDGTIDWDLLADKLAGSGRADALCIFQRVVGFVLASSAKASPIPHVDPELQKSLALEARIKRFGNVRVKTESGVE